MEDLKAYIETGILELYVLGDVTPDEKRQVEEMASKHPEIKAELDEIERSMELYAKENAVEPSENLRSRVLGSLLTNLGDDRNFSKAHPQKDNETDDEDEDNEDNIVTLPVQKKESGFYKYAFAASLALLVASTIALVNVYSKLQASNEQLVALQADKQHFANQVKLMDGELTVYRDTTYKLLRLKGTAKTPESVLTVAFSPVHKKVVIDLANMKMPVNDKAHQYQLWALVGGKPVDLGVFDSGADTLTNIKEMKSLASADAFAVTLEPRGGSVNPTMDQMMVIGKF
ncbi:anti-sigma factor [Mucilaginibacter sp. KACC 22773]|uniref:anti-sigma factor n=1 Tax=Mucilaginibacter sp. KACC 22773 TaxID=3025671 RepID=UPI0023650375|nr:anti-sigma factor [Mucilaginibacter sp. KACC 22773]WDF76872.1 anti-sigma factor [Mucilaginibacter sp. KACC 22773]